MNRARDYCAGCRHAGARQGNIDTVMTIPMLLLTQIRVMRMRVGHVDEERAIIIIKLNAARVDTEIGQHPRISRAVKAYLRPIGGPGEIPRIDVGVAPCSQP